MDESSFQEIVNFLTKDIFTVNPYTPAIYLSNYANHYEPVVDLIIHTRTRTFFHTYSFSDDTVVILTRVMNIHGTSNTGSNSDTQQSTPIPTETYYRYHCTTFIVFLKLSCFIC